MPAEYTYQVYMGFGFHPHMTLRPPLRKQIFFRGGVTVPGRTSGFFGVCPRPRPGPRPRPPVNQPGTRSSNEQRPYPARPLPPRPRRSGGGREGQPRPNLRSCRSIV
jgi:hypothetical protein